jgi:predicted small integral membrane protein
MLDWMYWTWKSALGFSLLASLLIGLAVLDHFSPGYSRKGLLPMATSRGDRVFLSIVGFVTYLLIWLKFFPDASSIWLFLFSGATACILMRWG